MKISFSCPMNFDVWYIDTKTNKPVPVPHTFSGEYEVEQLPPDKETPYGHTTFLLEGDQKGLWDGGQFEVPNPAFDEVKDEDNSWK